MSADFICLMIGVDTTILLRLWLNDAPAQNKRIDGLLAEHGSTPGSLLVTDVVLAEAVRTLRSAYDQDKAAQLTAVRSLLDETAFAFEDRAAIGLAVTIFDQGSCGFSDCLVAAKQLNWGASSPPLSTAACASCPASNCSEPAFVGRRLCYRRLSAHWIEHPCFDAQVLGGIAMVWAGESRVQVPPSFPGCWDVLTTKLTLIHWRLVSRRRGGFVNQEWFWIESYRTVAQVAGRRMRARYPAPEPDPF